MLRIFVLLLALGGSLYWWGLRTHDNHAPAVKEEPLVTVATVGARKQDVPVLLSALGTVQAFNTVQIRTKIDGTLDSVNFVEGQKVKKGDVLARIDPRLYQAALDQAKAKKAQDEAQLASDEKDLERSLSLAQRSFATKQTVDQQQATVQKGKALVLADDAAIHSAQTQLDYTTITAPFDGIIGLRGVDAGNEVHVSDATPIATLTQHQPISVIFTLPEAQLSQVRNAMKAGPVPVTAYDQNGQQAIAKGHLQVLDNQIDQTTGTAKMKAEFANKDDALWPGQFVPVKVQIDLRRDAITVPTAAIQRGPNGLYVWVVRQDERVAITPITAGPAYESVTIAEKGLAEGDQVVTSGQYRLQPGLKVQVETQGTASNAQRGS